MFKLTVVAGLLLSAAASSHAARLGPLDLTGFAKQEWSRESAGTHPTQPCYGDARGVLGFPGCGASTETTGPTTSWLSLVQLGAGLDHEFDNGLRVGAQFTRRWRDWHADIVGQPWLEQEAFVSDPVWGRLDLGRLVARSWSRQDGFSYPLGLSTTWSETGAGFSVLPRAIRYASRAMRLGDGKVTVEGTLATNDRFRSPYNPQYDAASPKPRFYEAFVQYSDAQNLVEFTYDAASGAGQSSWGKNPLVGAANLPVLTQPVETYGARPVQRVAILEGQHWFTPQWQLTWGLRRSYWSGSALTCDYATQFNGCVWRGGFNVSAQTLQPGTTLFPGWGASTRDWLLGLTTVRGMWTWSTAWVRLGHAHTGNPVAWGQGNASNSFKLNVSRNIDEWRHGLSVYGGLGYTRFAHLGPAPVSVPGNTALDGIDPRLNRQGVAATLGAQIVF